ncbi:MAG: 3-dehydroquinate synthase [Candidatus Dormibacteraceae bacterium]
MAIPDHPYPVLIGEGVLALLPQLLATHTGAAVVADRAASGFAGVLDAPLLEVDAGEGLKSLEGAGAVFDFLERTGIDRSGCLVAIGGGTVGDLAGFAAATWLRGVALYQVPTTLLAMVDSAIGGKTGINTALGKNRIGAFWQPSAVVADLRALDTLAEEEVRGGFGEVVKYGLAMDRELLARVTERAGPLLARSPPELEAVVARCAALKARSVAADERDLTGARAVLNYGHTAGHALETASGYSLQHGRAVAHGMRVAARLARALGLVGDEVVRAHDGALARFGLPGRLPAAIDLEEILRALPRDKKAVGGEPAWILPLAIGEVAPGRPVAGAAVREVLARYLEEAS